MLGEDKKKNTQIPSGKYIGIDNQTNIINIPRSRHRTNQHKPSFGAIQSQEIMVHSNSDFEYLPQNS